MTQEQCWLGIHDEHMRPTLLYRPKLSIDGNQWCALYGGENLQDGVAGFGDTPDAACRAFDRAWHDPLKGSLSARRFLVRDESGRGGSVGDLSAADLAERFGDDWEEAFEGECVPFADAVGALEVGGELRLDGATVVVRVS